MRCAAASLKGNMDIVPPRGIELCRHAAYFDPSDDTI
jgi:hypothetical protein